jgi:hypothetical protein
VTSDRQDLAFDDFLGPQNHGSMTRVVVGGVNVDVNWLRRSELLEKSGGEGYAAWWLFRNGRPIHDPEGYAAECQAAIRAWFERQPAVRAAWVRQQERLDARKGDPSVELEYPTFGDFHHYVRTLLEKGEG